MVMLLFLTCGLGVSFAADLTEAACRHGSESCVEQYEQDESSALHVELLQAQVQIGAMRGPPKESLAQTDAQVAGYAENEGNKYVLVSGGEGSGTTMVARILCESPNAIGIPANWELEELSERAQSKYTPSILRRLGGKTKQERRSEDPYRFLWLDELPDQPYITNGIDARNTETKSKYLNQVVDDSRFLLQEAKGVNTLVHHRSMPFAKNSTRTPFLEDIPELATQIAADGSAYLILVIRYPPKAWLSHAKPDNYHLFLARIEQLMSGDYEVPGLKILLVSHEELICDPKPIVEELARQLDLNIDALMASPQLAKADDIVSSHDDDSEYNRMLAVYEAKWEAERHEFPLYDQFQKSHAARCTLKH